MARWQVQVHQDVYDRLERWRDLRRKVEWTLIQLATTGGGSTIVKGFTAPEISWRRTPVEGNHFYLWWVPAGVSGTGGFERDGQAPTILVRAVAHHDDEITSVGHIDDYAPADLSALDPRYEDQRDVGSPPFEHVDLRIVPGSPGSGKTVALLFTAIKSVGRWSLEGSSDQRSVLYVTYTSGLAQQAQDYFETYDVGHKVETLTFDQLAGRVVGTRSDTSAYRRDRAARESFISWLGRQPDHAVGGWRAYPDLLWAELRAYLLGMALPFAWERQGLKRISPSDGVLGLEDYVEIRSQSLRAHVADIDSDALETAHRLAENAIGEEEFFAEQSLARSVLSRLREAQDESTWFGTFNTIAVDEIQDLTLLQIAALIEAARLAARGEREIPFLFVAAGDESQIVQPSGFDWGQTNDLLSQRLRQHPRHFPLRKQRRSPARLAQLITDSRTLYGNLPKGLSPKADAESAGSHSGEEGVLLRWRLSDGLKWEEVFE
jgi:hypothetical protein